MSIGEWDPRMDNHLGGRPEVPRHWDFWGLPPMPKEMTDVLEQLSQAEAKDYEQGMS